MFFRGVCGAAARVFEHGCECMTEPCVRIVSSGAVPQYVTARLGALEGHSIGG